MKDIAMFAILRNILSEDEDDEDEQNPAKTKVVRNVQR